MKLDGTGNPQVSLEVAVAKEDLRLGVLRLSTGAVKDRGGSWGEGTIPATSLFHFRE